MESRQRLFSLLIETENAAFLMVKMKKYIEYKVFPS